MIPEHEIIEQLMDEPDGRPVEKLLGALAPRSSEEVTRILKGLWRAGKVALASPVGALLADWESAALFRAESLPVVIRVLATERGINSVFLED